MLGGAYNKFMTKSDSQIYLDFAAATPVDASVIAAMQPFWSQNFYNPAAEYLAGRQARTALEAARGQIAAALGARPAEIIFTAGGTEANNLAINGVMGTATQNNPSVKSTIITSSIEHKSVLEPADQYNHLLAKVRPNGRVNIDALARQIDDTVALISIGLVNNEVGTMQNLSKIADLAQIVRADRQKRGINQPLWLHTDACQAPNIIKLQPARLGVDLMSVGGGKIYGPKQTGFLYVKAGTPLEAHVKGGGQEYGLRSGTPSVAGAVGLELAFRFAQQRAKDEAKRLAALRQEFVRKLAQQLPRSVVNGQHTAPHIISITIPGADAERLMMELDEQGIMVGLGAACGASSDQPSHVLSAMGISDQAARSSLRISLGRTTTGQELDHTVQVIGQLVGGVPTGRTA